MAGFSNKRLLSKLYVCIDFENGLLYSYFALSAMEKYLVESLLNREIQDFFDPKNHSEKGNSRYVLVGRR